MDENIVYAKLKSWPLKKSVTWYGAWVQTDPDNDDAMQMPFWMDVETGAGVHGPLVAVSQVKPQNLLAAMVGQVMPGTSMNHRPGTLEVGDLMTTQYLRAALAGLDIDVRHNEEIPNAQEIVPDPLGISGALLDLPDPLAGRGLTVEHYRAFAQASAAFYRAQPWTSLMDSDYVRSLSPKPLAGMNYASILGAGGQTFGLGFFHTKEQCRRASEGDVAALLECSELWSFELAPASDTPTVDVDFWRQHNLPLVAPDAYPVLIGICPGRSTKRPTARRMDYVTGLLGAIAHASEDDFDRGHWQARVDTAAGDVAYDMEMVNMSDPRATLDGFGDFDPRLMDKTMRHAQRALGAAGMESPKEMIAFLNENHIGKCIDVSPVNDKQRAEDLIDKAIESHGRSQLKLIHKALDLDPFCADAFSLLAERQSDPGKRCDLYEKAIDAARHSLGEEIFQEDAGMFWGIIETRPYMRARLALAIELCKQDHNDQAIEHFQQLLKLNPGDNQGVRYILAEVLLCMGYLDDFEDLLQRYDESSAQWLYFAAVGAWLAEGDTVAARRRRDSSFDANRHVPDFLTGRRDADEWAGTPYAPGDQSEGALVADALAELCVYHRGLVAWFEQCLTDNRFRIGRHHGRRRVKTGRGRPRR